MSDFDSLLLYLGVFIFSSAAIAYGAKRKIRPFIWIALLTPAILSGFRYEVGTDYIAYEEMFRELSQLNLSEYFRLASDNYEIGAYIFAVISYTLTEKSTIFFLLFSTLTILFFYVGMRRLNIKNEWLLFFLFLTILFPASFNMVRQALAMSILFYAFSFLIERKFLIYIAAVLLATCFHKTAVLAAPLVMLPLFIKEHSRISLRMIIITFIFGGIIIVITPQILDGLLASVNFLDKFSKYNNSDLTSSGMLIAVKGVLFMAATSLLYRARATQTGLGIFMVLASLEIFLGLAALYSINISRIGLYFAIPGILLYTYVPTIFITARLKLLAYTTIIAYGITYFIVAYYILGGSEIFPYNYLPTGGLA